MADISFGSSFLSRHSHSALQAASSLDIFSLPMAGFVAPPSGGISRH